MKVIFIGHSHTGMLRRAAVYIDGDPTIDQIRFRQQEIDAAGVRVKLAEVLDLKPDFTTADLHAAADERDVRFVLCVGGNAHFYVAHREQNPPIDFLHPPFSTKTDPARQLVPLVHIRRVIAGRLAKQLDILPNVAFPVARSLAVSCPPPVRSNAAIASALATRLKVEAEDIGIAPPRLRMAAWDINRQLTEEYWDSKGITFVMPPADTIDKLGFIRKRGNVDTNSTHTNVWYGRMVLRSLTFADGFRFAERPRP